MMITLLTTILPLLLLLLISTVTSRDMGVAVVNDSEGQLLPSPFEHPDQCGRYGKLRSAVCDPENQLSWTEKDIIEGSLNSLAHLSQGAVAIGNLNVSSTISRNTATTINKSPSDSNDSLTDITARVARATYEAWGIGRGTVDDRGFLIFLSLRDRTVYIAIGEGLEKTVPRDELTSIVSNMKVKLRSGEHAQAIVVAILEIKLLLSLSSEDPSQMWNSGSGSSNDSGGEEYEVTSSPTSAPGPGSHPPDTPGDRKTRPPPADDTWGGRHHAASAAYNNKDGALSSTKAAEKVRFGKSWPLLFPVAVLFGQAIFHRLEGNLALEDVIADSQKYSLDSDETIGMRKPTRCPHCLSPFFWPDDSAPPLTTSTTYLIKKSVNSYLGSKDTYQTPGSLPCGHIHCSSCIRKFIKRGEFNSWARANKGDSTQPNDEKARTRTGTSSRRGGKRTATAEFCRNCPVCTTVLSDWAATLNKIQVDKDSALLDSLRTSTMDNFDVDSKTSARVESLLARINRNKEISYAASRLRTKYGIAAVIDGSIIYDNADVGARGPYNVHSQHRRHRQGFGFGFGESRSFGADAASLGSSSIAAEQSMAVNDQDAGSGKDRDSDTRSLAQKLLSRMQRSQTAHSVSSSRSSQMTFATSGSIGAVSAPPPPTHRNPAPRKRDEEGAGTGGSW